MLPYVFNILAKFSYVFTSASYVSGTGDVSDDAMWMTSTARSSRSFNKYNCRVILLYSYYTCINIYGEYDISNIIRIVMTVKAQCFRYIFDFRTVRMCVAIRLVMKLCSNKSPTFNYINTEPSINKAHKQESDSAPVSITCYFRVRLYGIYVLYYIYVAKHALMVMQIG